MFFRFTWFRFAWFRFQYLLFTLLWVLLLVVDIASAAERKKKVLVLHSYHQGLEWTDNITRGIKDAFDTHDHHYEIHFEYLDTKRNSGIDYMNEVADFVSAKNARFKFHAVIVSDNNALTLLNQGKLHFKGNPPIIFCGINNYKPTLTANLEKVTGVVETTDYQGTLALMRKLHPERDHVYVVLDRTPTGDAIREEFRKVEEHFQSKLQIEFVRDFLLDELPERLADLDENHIAYILTFNRDRKNNFISYTEGIEMLSNSSSVPVYGSWDFYLGRGIVGGRITSGFLQGREAAKLADRVLHGEPIESIRVRTKSPVQYMFDARYLEKYNISTGLLPDGSVIINEPESVFEQYRLFLLVLVLVPIAILLWLFWRYKREHIALIEKKAHAQELAQLVEERTRELHDSNIKLKRLSNIDGLTELHNRRYFDQTILKEVRRLERTASPLSLLICDIDFFKRYNDTYGHLAGDDAIKLVADIINLNCKRVADVAARYGGEEFAVILPDTDAEQALTIAESIRKGVHSLKVEHSSSDIKETLSVSIGIATIIPLATTNPEELIKMADKALYESKHNGRDQSTVYR